MTIVSLVGQFRTRARGGGLWILGAFCLCLAAAGVEAQQSAPRPTRFQQLRSGVAHLGQAGLEGDRGAIQWLGTAFLVDDRCTVVTAKHAIENIPDGSLMLRFLGPEDRVFTHMARLIHTTEEADLAFLKFGPETGQKRFCAGLDARPLAVRSGGDRARLTGEPVWVLGYPALEGAPPRDVPIVRRGIVASAELDWLGRPMLLLDLTGMPGFSGGPVILERTGEAIGVVYGPGRTDRVFDVEWATPLSGADYDTAIGRKP